MGQVTKTGLNKVTFAILRAVGLTPTEVARRTGISTRTAMRW